MVSVWIGRRHTIEETIHRKIVQNYDTNAVETLAEQQSLNLELFALCVGGNCVADDSVGSPRQPDNTLVPASQSQPPPLCNSYVYTILHFFPLLFLLLLSLFFFFSFFFVDFVSHTTAEAAD